VRRFSLSVTLYSCGPLHIKPPPYLSCISPRSSNEQVVLDTLRGLHGVRLRNCEANIGRLKFSFSPVQVRRRSAVSRPCRTVVKHDTP